jgi:hypothetical protein
MLDAGFSFGIGGVVAISEYSSHKLLLPLSLHGRPTEYSTPALSRVLYCSFIYVSVHRRCCRKVHVQI